MFRNMFSGFDLIFSIGTPIVMLGFVVIVAVIIIKAIRGSVRWSRNNNSPILTVNSRIVAKRIAVSHQSHIHGDNMAMNHFSESSTYYATFEVESRDRMEFRISNSEYGMLAEGDKGFLSFQGTRYKGFERLK